MYLVVVDPASGSCTRKFEVKEAFHKMVLDVGWDAANENVAMLIWDAGSICLFCFGLFALLSVKCAQVRIC